jgi:hypothetical protein
MADEFSVRYGDLLTGSYDCVDRIVLNSYMSLCHSPGGFRVWWRRWHDDRDTELDNTHLMRLAGRFSRRVRAWAKSNAVPVIDCTRDERKHGIAEEYLATHPVGVRCSWSWWPGRRRRCGRCAARRLWGDPQPGEEEGVRQPWAAPPRGAAAGPGGHRGGRATQAAAVRHDRSPS